MCLFTISISSLKCVFKAGPADHIYNPSSSGGGCRGIMSLRPACPKLVRLFFKTKNTNKRTEGIAQVVECLPSIHEREERRKEGRRERKNTKLCPVFN
jgi:hypothetical protein